MRSQGNPKTALLAAALLLPIMGLQSLIAPFRPQYAPGRAKDSELMTGEVKSGNSTGTLPFEYLLGGLSGFREVIAGLLWVRCDEFFHNGDYDSIVPLVRIITWLDPHQIDVYETGAWHMDYNFTDTDQRSDRREIPLSLALLKEGIANNPDTVEMYSDLAFTHYYRKIGDFPAAAEWFEKGQKQLDKIIADYQAHPNDEELKQNAIDASKSIITLGHGLAHVMETTGHLDEADKQWQKCIDDHQRTIALKLFDPGNTFAEHMGLESAQKQQYELRQRRKWRQRDVAGQPPVDFQFRPMLVRIAPKVLVLKGTMNPIGSEGFNLETGAAKWGPVDGCRVTVRLNDEGYVMPVLPGFSLNSISLNPDTTIMQDSASVTKTKIGGLLGRKIDMSKDPAMYSFKAPKYHVTLWYNPSNPQDSPLQVQDRIGWMGEGLTDPQHLDTSGKVPGDVSSVVPGLRILKIEKTISREDIVGKGEKVLIP